MVCPRCGCRTFQKFCQCSPDHFVDPCEELAAREEAGGQPVTQAEWDEAMGLNGTDG